MQPRNLPAIGPRYWVMIVLASVFGTNMGDFLAHNGGLGHVQGLLPLAVVFAAILLAEWRTPVATDAFYWLAVVTLRTAATNLGDFATHDLRLDPPTVMAGLAVALAVLLGLRRALRTAGAGLPPVTGWYWAAMLLASTLGTVLGDYVADDIGLGVGMGSVACSAVAVALIGALNQPRLNTKLLYWAAVVAVRTAATDIGDFLASRHGLGLGLSVSTTLTGAVFALTLLVWRRRGASGLVAG